MNDFKHKMLKPLLLAVSILCFWIIKINKSKKKLESKINDIRK